MSELVKRAIRFATEAHDRIDQRRKYSGRPYTEHLNQVARIVATVTDDEEMLAAAWLHDVVEDTPATLEDIEREFGPAVARLVWELTDVSRPGDGNRATRKALDRAHLARASDRAQTVKLADLIDNCQDITRHDPRFARVFLDEMAALLAVLDRADATLMRRARRTLARCQAHLSRETPPAQETPPPEADHWHPIRNQFDGLFTARDIAEPIPLSFDIATPPDRIAAAMRASGCPVATVRRDGRTVGYLTRQRLERAQTCETATQPFLPDQLLPAEAGFAEVIHVLTRHDVGFVQTRGEVTGHVTRGDINKPYMRMWLFGIITLTEMHLNEWLRHRFPDDTWQAQLPPARLAAAQRLQRERKRLGQRCALLDCLQLADKGLLLLKADDMLARLGFGSRNAARTVLRQFQSLRNNLAHAQDISTYDWVQIARIAKRILE